MRGQVPGAADGHEPALSDRALAGPLPLALGAGGRLPRAGASIVGCRPESGSSEERSWRDGAGSGEGPFPLLSRVRDVRGVGETVRGTAPSGRSSHPMRLSWYAKRTIRAVCRTVVLPVPLASVRRAQGSWGGKLDHARLL